MELQGYIADLLHKHDCVIVPDFGGFVTNYRSAVIDKVRNKIYPPSKSVLFNVQLKSNDGLLGNYVSREEEMTYSDAMDYINQGVRNWKIAFEQGERIEIGEIGFLYQENGRVHFEQSREVNLLLQAYGLKSIDFIPFKKEERKTDPVRTIENKPVVKSIEKVEEQSFASKSLKLASERAKVSEDREEKVAGKQEVEVREKKIIEKEKQENAELVEEETPVIALDNGQQILQHTENIQETENAEPVKRNIGMTILRYTAAAAIVPVLFYSYWIPMETDAVETKAIQLSDFNPIHKQSNRVYAERESDFNPQEIDGIRGWDELTGDIDANVYNLEVTEDLYIPILLLNEKSESTASNEIAIVGDYHVISGCFSVKANAENLVADLNKSGFTAAILDKNKGLHRVTAGGYSTRDAAESGLEKLRSAGHSGWILKK